MPAPVKRRFPLAAITADMVYAATMAQPFQGRLLTEWATNLENDRLARITNAVRSGYLNGATTEQIARKVRGTAANNFQDGAIQVSRANATSIAKTAISHVAAVARDSSQQRKRHRGRKEWLIHTGYQDHADLHYSRPPKVHAG